MHVQYYMFFLDVWKIMHNVHRDIFSFYSTSIYYKNIAVFRKNIYFINYKILNIDYGIRCHFMGERTKFETPEIESNPISDTYGASLVSIHWRVHFSVSPHVLVLFLSLNRLIFAPIGRFSRFIRYPFSYLQEHVWFTIFDSLRKYSYLKKTVRNGFIY